MKRDDGYLITKDQYELYWQSWAPSRDPIASVFIIHGIADHSSRFEHVARHFCNHEIACFSMDLRGHGKSSGTRAYINEFSDYLLDLDAGWKQMEMQLSNPTIPRFLFGHSMGSLIAIHFIKLRKPDQSGLITTAALVKVNEDLSPILVKLSGFLSTITPKLQTIKLDLNLLSSDPSVKRAAEEDTLYNKDGLRARTGAEILKATKQATGFIKDISSPLLIMHGEKDQLTKPESSILFSEKAGSTDKQYVSFPNGMHELVNEVNKEEILEKMSNWITDRI
jgi:alpha-beta hydrolase superfamily lysophospholipase